jgi:hypothetical protein
MKIMYKTLSLRIITGLMLLSLPFLGSDCEDILNQINNPPTGNLQGDWTLIYNAGSTLDVCPGETANFPSNTNGTATLKCPNQTQITRDYSVSDSTLTYTASGVQYQIAFTQEGQLVLSGINNNRILYYGNNVPATKPGSETINQDAPSFHSSEKINK